MSCAARLVPIQITDSGRALVLVRGYLSRRENTEEESLHWWTAIRESGWPHSIYQLWWDASTPYDFSTNLLKTVLVPGMPLKALAAASEALRHWRMVRNLAQVTGRDHLHTLLAPLSHERLTLVGFSLGALLLYHGLQQPNRSLQVERLVFLGGALSPATARDWRGLMDHVDGALINLYNPNDHALKYFYRLSYLPLPDRDQLLGIAAKAKHGSSSVQLRQAGRSLKARARTLKDRARAGFEALAEGDTSPFRPDLYAGINALESAWHRLRQDGLPKPPTPCGLRPIQTNSEQHQWRVINSDMSAALGNHARNHWRYWRVIGEALQGQES